MFVNFANVHAKKRLLFFRYLAVCEVEFASGVLFRPYDIVGGHDNRDAGFGYTIQQIHDFFASLMVKITCRLVGKNQRRHVQ